MRRRVQHAQPTACLMRVRCYRPTVVICADGTGSRSCFQACRRQLEDLPEYISSDSFLHSS